MKILLHILVAYILVLAVVPCCSMDICHDDEDVVVNTTAGEHEEKDDCNNCSPFAFCSSCPGFSVDTPLIHIQPVFFANDQVYSSFIASYTSVHAGVLIQPPRSV